MEGFEREGSKGEKRQSPVWDLGNRKSWTWRSERLGRIGRQAGFLLVLSLTDAMEVSLGQSLGVWRPGPLPRQGSPEWSQLSEQMTSPGTHVVETWAPWDALGASIIQPWGSNYVPHRKHGNIENAGSIPFSTLRCGSPDSPNCDHTPKLQKGPHNGARIPASLTCSEVRGGGGASRVHSPRAPTRSPLRKREKRAAEATEAAILR